MNIIERKKALETMRKLKIEELQKLEMMRNELTTEIIKIEGKIELVNELEKEA